MAGPVSARLGTEVPRTIAAAPAPNPARAGTVFQYTIGADVAGGGPVPVSLSLLDIQGRLVTQLKQDLESAGRYEVTWNGRDGDGHRVARGVYYYLFRAGAVTSTAKVTVVD